jgi:hypothetical protein
VGGLASGSKGSFQHPYGRCTWCNAPCPEVNTSTGYQGICYTISNPPWTNFGLRTTEEIRAAVNREVRWIRRNPELLGSFIRRSELPQPLLTV